VIQFSLAIVHLKGATQLGCHIRHNKKFTIASPGNAYILWDKLTELLFFFMLVKRLNAPDLIPVPRG